MTAALSFAQRVMIWKNAAVSTRTPTKSSSSSSPSQVSRLDQFFHITERGSSISREIRGGIVTFFSMSYILVLNPAILSKASPPGTEAQLAAGTAFVAAVMTILMGVVANYPMALAAGLGINAMVAYTLVGTQGMTYADAMGLIVIEGIIILVLVLTGFREAVGSTLTGDRRAYQQDPANRREGLREVMLDVEEGADIVMVKPAGPYLDVLADVAAASPVPVAAYQVSGEYAMVEAAAQRGWVDREHVIAESVLGIVRAGADMVLTYWAREIAENPALH